VAGRSLSVLDSPAMPSRQILPLILVAALALPLAACGGDSASRDEQPASGAAAQSSTPTAAETVELLAQGISEDRKTKPVVAVPAGETPTELVVRDIVKGTGETARKGAQVTVQYVGSAWSTGQEFDASWDKGEPFTFPLGQGQVISGWDKGVAGMKVGGRRLLVIPGDLAYGAQGSPPAIGPDETLAFVVDLEKVG
jgi:peptidylprolyl isomerase